MAPAPGFTVYLGSSTGGSLSADLYLRYRDICTNFNHDGTASTFSGNALLSNGVAIAYTYTNTITAEFRGVGALVGPATLGAAPNLTFTALTALWSSSQGFAHFTLPTVTTSLGYSSFKFGSTEVITALHGTLNFSYVSFSTVSGTTTCQGGANVDLIGNASVTDIATTNLVLQMSRTATCPV